jgi:hypothetical protein
MSTITPSRAVLDVIMGEGGRCGHLNSPHVDLIMEWKVPPENRTDATFLTANHRVNLLKTTIEEGLEETDKGIKAARRDKLIRIKHLDEAIRISAGEPNKNGIIEEKNSEAYRDHAKWLYKRSYAEMMEDFHWQRYQDYLFLYKYFVPAMLDKHEAWLNESVRYYKREVPKLDRRLKELRQ